jgi:DNA-binding transcriptional MerR regulator
MSVVIDGKKYYWTLEFCQKARISRSTLLRWLKGGILEEPIRDRRGWRIFSEEDLKRIKAEVGRTRENKDV